MLLELEVGLEILGGRRLLRLERGARVYLYTSTYMYMHAYIHTWKAALLRMGVTVPVPSDAMASNTMPDVVFITTEDTRPCGAPPLTCARVCVCV